MDENGIELEENYAVITIPKRAIEITLAIKVFIDGKVENVERKMDILEIQEAFKEAVDGGYVPPDAVFTLTEKGRRQLEEMRE